MSGLQLYLESETVVDFKLKYGEDKNKLAQKASLMLLNEFTTKINSEDKDFITLNIRELQKDRQVTLEPDTDFTLTVNDGDIDHIVKCTVFYKYDDDRPWLVMDADRDHVYISKHRHRNS